MCNVFYMQNTIFLILKPELIATIPFTLMINNLFSTLLSDNHLGNGTCPCCLCTSYRI